MFSTTDAARGHEPVSECSQNHSIFVFERDISQGSSQRDREFGFCRGAIIHRVRAVEQDGNRNVLFSLKYAQEETFQARIGEPVYAAEVIARSVTPVIGELKRRACQR